MLFLQVYSWLNKHQRQHIFNWDEVVWINKDLKDSFLCPVLAPEDFIKLPFSSFSPLLLSAWYFPAIPSCLLALFFSLPKPPPHFSCIDQVAFPTEKVALPCLGHNCIDKCCYHHFGYRSVQMVLIGNTAHEIFPPSCLLSPLKITSHLVALFSGEWSDPASLCHSNHEESIFHLRRHPWRNIWSLVKLRKREMAAASFEVMFSIVALSLKDLLPTRHFSSQLY